jgi:hypothetical protein
MMHAPKAVSLVLVALAALPAGLAAQQGRPSSLIGAEFRTVSFDSGLGVKRLTEFAVPLGISLPLGRRVLVDAGTYVVHAERTDETNASSTISGLSDVVVRGAFQLKPDVAVFTVALNLPTGHATLDGTEVLVAGAMATDLISFPVQNFGSGVSLTTGLALAAPVGSWALGVAGSYRYNGSYTPFSDTSLSLRPGGEVRIRVGADRIVGQGRFSFGLTYSTFSSDEFGNRSLSPGGRIIPQIAWTIPMGNNSLALYAWDIYRNVNENAANATGVKQNTVAAGAIFSVRTGRNVLRPQLEYRQAWKGPGGMTADGKLVTLGLRYSIAASNRLSLVPGLRFDVGSLPNLAGTNVSFTGVSANLSVRTSF